MKFHQNRPNCLNCRAFTQKRTDIHTSSAKPNMFSHFEWRDIKTDRKTRDTQLRRTLTKQISVGSVVGSLWATVTAVVWSGQQQDDPRPHAVLGALGWKQRTRRCENILYRRHVIILITRNLKTRERVLLLTWMLETNKNMYIFYCSTKGSATFLRRFGWEPPSWRLQVFFCKFNWFC